MSEYHTPVMLEAVLAGLAVRPGKRYIDATAGGAGHAREIVKRQGRLLGIDTDKEAIAQAKQTLGQLSGWKLVQGNFARIQQIAQSEGFVPVEGILFDLGVSSHQLETRERGFSYRFGDAPLDLRFDQTSGIAAKEFIRTLTEGELYEIFARFGEEQLAGPIAHAVVGARRVAPIDTTGRLEEVVSQVLPNPKYRIKALARIFQALRGAVNDEACSLKQGLEGAKMLLERGGRLVVISFQSLEDRQVKQFMRGGGWKMITKKPTLPTPAEIRLNSRARSAKLRVAEKL